MRPQWSGGTRARVWHRQSDRWSSRSNVEVATFS